MNPERDNYQAVLESLADGAEVDWGALESAAATSAERQRFRNLRLVARVAELHRTLSIDEGERFAPRDGAAEAPPEPLTTWGHLRVGERIASGAYGELYVAHDPQLNRDVALKILRRGGIASGQSIDQLLAEARTLAKVRHANVVTIHGADVRDGRAALWMELVHGQTLESWMQVHGTLGAGEASALGVDVCRALAAVHAAGLVHGDIKAQNVMRENGGRVVLMDFGAGRVQGAEAIGVAGTPLYLAPEVLAGEPPTTRSDIYSVGVLLFHLLTGAYPCNAGDLEGLRAAHADGTRMWLRDLRPDLPDALVQGIERALDPDPARRFATAGEMERALTAALHRVPDAVTTRTVTRGRSSMFGFAAAAAAFLCVVVGLIVWSRTVESSRGAVLAEVRTIGVLPMADLTGSSLPAHFADGLTDELIATLGQVNGLTVKPALSAAPREQRSLKDVARALDVDALLDTTLSAQGDGAGGPARLKVRAKLIAAGTQGIVWTEEFERPRGDTLALPKAVAAAIARAVHAEVTAEESARLTSSRQTNPATEEAYLLGRTHLDQYGSGSADQALKAFQRALQLDPAHAGAHAGAAWAHLTLGSTGAISHPQARAAALAEARRALELDPDLADAHTTLAYINFVYDWDWSGSEREFLRSLELNANSPYARALYADYLSARRRFDESVSQAETAKRLDPESGAAARRYVMVLYYKRDLRGADRALQEARSVEPNNAAVPLLEGRIAEARGLFNAALDSTMQALQLSRGGTVPLRVQQIRLQALAGRREEALAGVQSLQREAASRTIRMGARDMGYIHLALGDKEQALQFFAQAVDERDPTVVWLGVDPRLDALQHDPRFQQLLRIIGLPVRP